MTHLICTLFLSFSLGSSFIAEAQGNAKAGAAGQSVFTFVEEMPAFHGDLNKHMIDNVRYPEDAMQDKVEGRVVVRFVVDYTGRVKDVTVVKGVHPSLDSEATRVVETMPNWSPGKKDGKPVSVYFTLPVSFILDKEKQEKKG